MGAFGGNYSFWSNYAIIAILIWLESGRPIIFLNERVGHKGNFDLYKFRYMKKEYSHGKQFSEEHNKKALQYLQELN